MSFYGKKNIWIIGASSGIGRSLAIELASQGATLILSARSESKLHDLNQDLGEQHYVLPLNVIDVESFRVAVESIKGKFSSLDSVILMAATYHPGFLDEMDIKSGYQIIDVNFKGALNMIYTVLPIFKKQGFGQIALCGSVAGYRGLPKGQPYSATKSAVISLAESLRAEEPDLDIKIINPGFVRTLMTDKNDFEMPMMIEANEAAKIITRELQTKRFEIHFPKKFTALMKIIRLFPPWLYFLFVKKMR